jgi:hypothetical protein
MARDWDDEMTLGRPGEAVLAFGEPKFVMDGSKLGLIPVRASSNGLVVESSIELAPWGQDTWIQALIAYLDDLDRSWRGWSGVKEWSDAAQSVTLSAVHHSTLVATLTVTFKHPPVSAGGAGEWNASVAVPFEPAAFARLAKRFRAELARAPWEVPTLPLKG